MTRPGDRLHAFASRVCSNKTMYRLVDPLIADLQFEHAEMLARGERWRARLATMRAIVALARVLVAADGAFRRIGLAALGSTALLVMALSMVPLLALLTGAYSAMPIAAADVLLLLVYFTPVALAVVTPAGVAFGVLIVCRRPSDARHMRVPLALLVVAASALACVLFLYVAPIASAAFRDLARPIGGELRVNVNGSVGYRFEQQEKWAWLFATAVLTLFAASAAAAATRRRAWLRAAAGIASLLYMFLYLPAGMLAFERLIPVPLAVWLPNIAYVAMTIALVRFNPATRSLSL